MRAAIQTRFGGPDVLQLRETPDPLPAPDEILVRVHAAAVTQGDRRLRAADYPGISAVIGRLLFGVFKPKHPTGGTMFAGQVVAVGASVTRFAVGDDVFGGCEHGAYAELLAVGEGSQVARMPAGWTYAEAASVPYGAGTALAFLRDLAAVQPGERVVVVGAAGGVGSYGVQVAKALGARVTGVCSAKDAAFVRELGADEIVDYRSQTWQDSGTWDVVFDTVSGRGFRAAKRALTEGGRYVTLFMDVPVLLQVLWTTLFGSRRVKATAVLGSQALTEAVAERMADGSVRALVGPTFEFEEIVAAHAAVESKARRGVVVVQPTPAAEESNDSPPGRARALA